MSPYMSVKAKIAQDDQLVYRFESVDGELAKEGWNFHPVFTLGVSASLS